MTRGLRDAANPFRDALPPVPALANLQLRLVTAGIGLPLVVGLTWLGGWPYAAAAGCIALLAAAEFVHGWLFPSMRVVEAFRMAPALLVVGATVVGSHASSEAPLAAVLLAAMAAVAGYAPPTRLGPRKPYRVFAWAFLYLGVLFSCAVLVRDLEGGRSWAFLGLLATFATDTGAYGVGRLVGRHLLAPSISPKKTWEGAVGGYAVGFGAVLVCNALFNTGESAATIIPLAASLPVAAQAGDLLESWMKRRMGVKDASGLLPGHGGFLDRLDSVLFVMPLVYLFVNWRVL